MYISFMSIRLHNYSTLLMNRSTVNILKEAEPNNPLKPIMNCLGGNGGGGGQVFTPPGASATAAAASSVFNIPGLGSLGDFSLLGGGSSKKKSEAIGKYD